MANFFDLNVKILKMSGLWIPTEKISRPKLWTTLIYNAIFVFYSMIFFTIAEIVALKKSSENINDLVKNLNMSMSFLLTFFKVSVWFCNRKKIVFIMDRLQSTAKFFIPSKGFEPHEVFQKEKKVKDGLTYTFFVIACTVPTSACLLTFYGVITDDANEDYNCTQVGYHHKLPYASFVPFDYTASKFSFSMAVIYQCLALLICGMITVGFDMLYMSIVNFTSAHLKNLQGAFKNVRLVCEKKLHLKSSDPIFSSAELDAAMQVEMKVYVQHLQEILSICESLENIFTYLILFQMLVSLVVFCTCLYLVSSIPIGAQVFGNEVAYMLAIENQLALYCYAGNKLTLRGEGIPFAIYSIDWFSATKKIKTNMLITIMRMNKPILLTAGKFTPLALATFVTIGRGSYSLLAVLKNR